MSQYENKIINLLNDADITYNREYIFKDLRGGRYRFDFYIPLPRPMLIEVQGEQHYQFISKFYKNKVEWQQAQGRDMRKISYALANKIPLYIIPYWEIKKLRVAADLFQPKFQPKNKYHNFDTWRDHCKNQQ